MSIMMESQTINTNSLEPDSIRNLPPSDVLENRPASHPITSQMDPRTCKGSWRYMRKTEEDGRKFYQCRICMSSYDSKRNFNEHWREKHFSDQEQPKPKSDEDYGSSEESSVNDENASSSNDFSSNTPTSINEKHLTAFSSIPKRPFSSKASRYSLAPNFNSNTSHLKRTREDENENKENQTPQNMPMLKRHSLTPFNSISDNTGYTSPFRSFIPDFQKKSPQVLGDKSNIPNTLDFQQRSKTHSQSNGTTNAPLDLSKPNDFKPMTPQIPAKERPILPSLQPTSNSSLDVKMLIVLLKTLVTALENESVTNFSEVSATTIQLIHTFGSLLSGIEKKSPVQIPPSTLNAPIIAQSPSNPTTSFPTPFTNSNFPLVNPGLNFNIPMPALMPDVSMHLGDQPFSNLFTNIPNDSLNHMTEEQRQSKKRFSLKSNTPSQRKSLTSTKDLSAKKTAPGDASPIQRLSRKTLPITDNFLYANQKMTLSCGSEVIGPIMCKLCSFEARWFSELRAHMVNHSEHRMFGCCYCNYRAKWKWDVAKHMRRCALSRHVAHLPNEGLLRMVNYHAPPEGDVLFNFFPKSGYPGVGVDRPIAAPPAYSQAGTEENSLSMVSSFDIDNNENENNLNKDSSNNLVKMEDI